MMPGNGEEFVKGWHLLDTLGEGRFGEVKLLINKNTRELVAVKVLVIKNIEMDKQVRKEISIHRHLNHPNIIDFFGNRRDNDLNIEYLFLQYATNGELFEKIEPDIGMEKFSAFKYWFDLLDGLKYLHQRGICHRDIKPENLLLDDENRLKISDFGMATLFRHNGQERFLNQMCGSIPYMAPEMLQNKPHRAEPIDIWSCAIVLVAMLTGELPWSEATIQNKLFKKWTIKTFSLHLSPWCKIDTITLAMLRSILDPCPEKRLTLEKILSHRSCLNMMNEIEKNKSQTSIKRKSFHTTSLKKQCRGLLSQPQISKVSKESHFSSSMDIDNFDGDDGEDDQKFADDEFIDERKFSSFSQPNKIEDMFLSTQTQNEIFALSGDTDQPISQSSSSTHTPPNTRLYLSVVRRMTRFVTNKNFDRTIETLEKTFNDLNWIFKKRNHCQFTINAVDRNRIPLVFKSSVNEMSPQEILVDFRLSKGNGIEFKRHFLIIKNILKPIIVQQR